MHKIGSLVEYFAFHRDYNDLGIIISARDDREMNDTIYLIKWTGNIVANEHPTSFCEYSHTSLRARKKFKVHQAVK